VTILDGCISLNSVQNFVVELGVVDMCHLLLNIMKVQANGNKNPITKVFETHCVFLWYTNNLMAYT
jgi:methenyltetrahydromethanopterin cyclohydrolase